jgi:hypothetical protein
MRSLEKDHRAELPGGVNAEEWEGRFLDEGF